MVGVEKHPIHHGICKKKGEKKEEGKKSKKWTTILGLIQA